MIEVICSGFGGQGVLVAGMILADAGMEDNKQVSWYPSYGFEMRGGAANCDVKISDEEIPSPFCLEPDIVYTLNETAIDTYESRLKPGGVLLVNSSLVPDERTYRDDIQVIKVPATTIADELGNPKGTNIVMLGALACASAPSVVRRSSSSKSAFLFSRAYASSFSVISRSLASIRCRISLSMRL